VRASPNPRHAARRTRPTAATASIALHALLIATIVAAGHFAPRVTPIRMPGTAAGTHLLPVYSLGGVTGALAESKPAPAPRPATPTIAPPKPQPAPTPQPTGAAPDPGPGNSGLAAFGDGNINIALIQKHTSPAPDLSVLPHGTRGDVMLSIVIDATGHITDIKLDKGIDPTIDKTVIATVQQWLFAPATRNGQPVASEQELLFHYERS
jgi:protein TonB